MLTFNKKPISILNKKLEISYEDAFFTFEIDSNKKMKWLLKNRNKILFNSISSVFVKHVSDDKIIMEWITDDKTVVSKVINLSTNIVDCVFYNNNNPKSFTGTITLN